MTRTVQNVIDIMRVALGRRNALDPDATDNTLITYLNDFVHITMSNDTRLFENFGTLSFTIDETTQDGVYTFNDVGAEFQFETISNMAFISLLDPINNSVSWNVLPIYQDPGEFFAIWGINNDEILVRGYPTGVLFYGNEFTFRTLPEQPYLVKFYGYKQQPDYGAPNETIQFDRWLRYLAYGAAVNYARDYRYEPSARAMIEETFKKERALVLTRTHNQIKTSRCMPSF